MLLTQIMNKATAYSDRVDNCNPNLSVETYSNIYAFRNSLIDTGNLFNATTIPDNIRFVEWHDIPPTPPNPLNY